MGDTVSLTVNGRTVSVPRGTTVAAAMAIAGVAHVRASVRGAPRGPLCGMGICFECRAAIDGVPHRRTCQIACEPGMEVTTDG